MIAVTTFSSISFTIDTAPYGCSTIESESKFYKWLMSLKFPDFRLSHLAPEKGKIKLTFDYRGFGDFVAGITSLRLVINENAQRILKTDHT